MSDYSDAQLKQFGQQLKKLMAQQDAGTLPWSTATERAADDAPDWREQAYEDAYWAERVAVSTWDATTVRLFEQALGQIEITRAEERGEVIGLLGS